MRAAQAASGSGNVVRYAKNFSSGVSDPIFSNVPPPINMNVYEFSRP
jgi:hypothetical protein